MLTTHSFSIHTFFFFKLSSHKAHTTMCVPENHTQILFNNKSLKKVYFLRNKMLESHVAFTSQVPFLFYYFETFSYFESGPFYIHIHPISLQIYLEPPSVTNNNIPSMITSYLKSDNFLSHFHVLITTS